MLSSHYAISVERLGKYYRLGAFQGRYQYKSLRDSLASAVRAPLRSMRGQRPDPRRDLWALHDVSFAIEHGDVLGIIGRNGAGKSTLLKIISRIVEPTHGRVEVHGPVGSLLEVGTGFHPELTGRENIYLNGAILGMAKVDIERRFDEIVAFAELEQFLDTPVKRYSSGMYMRLAFSVAAHLDPEVLLVDEVLAVGDAQFQRKCLGKMGEVAGNGRTVVLVSHNMGAIRRLCNKTALLDRGALTYFGDTETAIDAYQTAVTQATEASNGRFQRRSDDVPARATWVHAVELQDGSGNPSTRFRYGDDLRIVFELAGLPTQEGTSLHWMLSDARGAPIAWANSLITCGFALQTGERHAVCTIKRLPLAIGRYTFTFSGGITGSSEPKDFWRDAASFEVVASDPFDTHHEHHDTSGAVVLDQTWTRL